MLIKAIVVILFLSIIASLGTALFHLVKHKDQENSDKTAKALTFRIGLSLVLFFILFAALALGIFKPHGIGTKINPTNQSSQ